MLFRWRFVLKLYFYFDNIKIFLKNSISALKFLPPSPVTLIVIVRSIYTIGSKIIWTNEESFLERAVVILFNKIVFVFFLNQFALNKIILKITIYVYRLYIIYVFNENCIIFFWGPFNAFIHTEHDVKLANRSLNTFNN